MDKNNYAIPEELKFMFTELNYLFKNKNNFVILTKKDVKLLKKYSKELNLNLDFPIFETEKSNFVSFNKGKMDTVFPEFTNML